MSGQADDVVPGPSFGRVGEYFLCFVERNQVPQKNLVKTA
jgi:hypothetical protein